MIERRLFLTQDLLKIEITAVVLLIYTLVWLPKYPYSSLINVCLFFLVLLYELRQQACGQFVKFIRYLPQAIYASLKSDISISLNLIVVGLGLTLLVGFLGVVLGTIHPAGTGLARIPAYLCFAFVQQFLLQIIIYNRAIKIFDTRNRAMLFSVFIFAGAHMPNFTLALICLLSGFILVSIYRKTQNLLLVVVLHFIFGITWSLSLENKSMRVGYGHYSAVVRKQSNFFENPFITNKP